ncbi:aldehyde dehydrogenase [Alkalihalobacillus sp. BA299]|uniref:aldehyde dehydrogenase n=1 Tax=Alkalihalobacillus sp. BA299 TaxID=2815938 RepID=UPI001ADC9138|nr:aldehyde dehydrogenase [Alkalihalobacillus sp. BA299]
MSETYEQLLQLQRNYFYSGETKDVHFRIQQLKKLKNAIKANEKKLSDALRKDLNKSDFESYLTELGVLYNEITEAVKHVKAWAKPRKVKMPITHVGSDSYIYPEPYGVSLIISPWNFPVNLTIAPIIGAIAAGCCAIVKPSELTPNTSGILAHLLKQTFEDRYIAVVEGDVATSKALLALNFDHIFFTGSVTVGKVVMEAAAKHLTPITLELGGKSPTIVHKDAKLDVAAKRIAWGKFTNAGQTCVAPDYLLIHKSIKERFLEKLMYQIKDQFGDDVTQNSDYPRVVNGSHFDRLLSYMKDGTIVFGGRSIRERLFIAPTILENVTWNSAVMEEEIFGPILPVIEYETEQEVIDMVRKRPNSLALYLFAENKKMEQVVLKHLSFGGGCINDVIYHVGTTRLPFGGVGSSGIGAYHGKYSFDAFSHEKGVMHQSTKIDIPFRYHKTKGGLKVLKRIMK